MTIDLAKLDIVPGAESKEGFANALASKAPGGIQLMPNGSIRRDATLGLAALRRLAALESDGTLSEDRTKLLRRYILGLSLVALTAPHDPYLRQGCNLVPDCDKPREFKLVTLDGNRPDFAFSHTAAIEYARDAMRAFGIESGREEPFDVGLAEKAGEARAEKIKGNVVFVDLAGKKFRLKPAKGNEIEIQVNDDTVIKKGKISSTLDAAVTVGATLNVELLKGIAIAIVAKK
jgi:CRISPR-associated protein Csb1